MKTKEAIRFCKSFSRANCEGFPTMFNEDDSKKIEKVTKLLKRGEKFEKMWGEFNYLPHVTVKNVQELINELEQKYFPKEE